MHIPPQRRQRILKAHSLRQQGHSLRQIAELLGVSHATVRADLQLLETHWSEIAAAAADDVLLEQLHLLREQLVRLDALDIIQEFGQHLPPSELQRAVEAHYARVLAMVRELRRTANEIHRRARERQARPELAAEVAASLETAETTPRSSTTIHPESTISQPEQEIVEIDPAEEKNGPETIHAALELALDPVIEETIELFPHLQGQPREQVLAFLDQLTDPNQPEVPIAYAAAAGGA